MRSLNGRIDERFEPEILKSDLDYPKKSVYTSVRTYGKKPFRLDDHLLRLQESARLEGFELPHTIEQIRRWVIGLLEKNYSGDQFIKIIATPKNIVINSRELVTDDKIYEGVRVIFRPVIRSNVKSKSSDVSAQTKAYQEALHDKAYEALLLNEENNIITEGSRSNVFWVKHGVLFWCDEALSGITQKTVLELAKKLGLQAQQSRLAVDKIGDIDEMFLTQTSKGIVPVTSLNVLKIGDGNVGPVTRQLMKAFNEITSAL